MYNGGEDYDGYVDMETDVAIAGNVEKGGDRARRLLWRSFSNCQGGGGCGDNSICPVYRDAVGAGLAVAGVAMHPPFIDNNDNDNGGRVDNDFGDKDYLAQECISNQPRGEPLATSICSGGHVGRQ